MQQKSSIENRIILLNFYTFLFSIALQSSVIITTIIMMIQYARVTNHFI